MKFLNGYIDFDCLLLLVVLLVLSLVLLKDKLNLFFSSGTTRENDLQYGGANVNMNANVNANVGMNKKTKVSNNLINPLKFASETDKFQVNEKYSSQFADLNSQRAWSSDLNAPMTSYLEITFPRYYHLNGLVTRGYEGVDEWVTKYLLEYYNPLNEQWKKYEQVFEGNVDDFSDRINRLDLYASAIRIIPVNWHHRPSLRIGFFGTKQEYSRCQYYQEQIKIKTGLESERFKQLYNDECRTIALQKYKSLQELYRQCKQELTDSKKQIEILTKKTSQLKIKLSQDLVPREQLEELADKYLALSLEKSP